MPNKNISVLLSSSKNFRNTGMFSVEYSAYIFLRQNIPNMNMRFYVFELPDKGHYPYEDLMPYSIYQEIDEVSIYNIIASDVIIYWSDFFHTKHFHHEFLTDYVLSKYHGREKVAKNDLFYKAFFLEGCSPEVLEKVIIFGTSMMFNEFENRNFEDKRHSDALYRLYKCAPLIMLRDRVSYENAIKIVGIHSAGMNQRIKQGCDPALLLPAPDPVRKENVLGLFIGRRTEISLVNVLSIILAASKLRYRIEWIPWMRNEGSLLKRAIENPRQAKNLFYHWALSKIFAAKRKRPRPFRNLTPYSLIITDTYHLSINGLADRTDTMCIGSDSIIYGKSAKDLHDKKKKVFYQSVNKNYLYFDQAELTCRKIVNNHYRKRGGLNLHDRKTIKGIKRILRNSIMKVLGEL